MHIQNRLFFHINFIILSLWLMVTVLFVCDMPPVYADGLLDDVVDTHYTLSYTSVQDDPNMPNGYRHETSASFGSQYPLFLYKDGSNDYDNPGFRQYKVGVFVDGECITLSPNNGFATFFFQTIYKKTNGEVGSIFKQNTLESTSFTAMIGFTVYSESDYECDSFVFDSLTSAQAYYTTGSRDGVISSPAPDYNGFHDFSKDVYSPEIPVPELSNLTHNSFHVNNADPSRDIEIYVKSKFYGVKHSGNSLAGLLSGAVVCETDTSWEYSSHYFNLINTDISYSDADIDIKKLFRADNTGALVEDFKKWSLQYPTHKQLPDYSYLKHSSGALDSAYAMSHNYNTCLGTTDEQKLVNSGQATTTFFVRFCQYVPGEGYTYGKWVSYTYTPGGAFQKDTVAVGDVAADPKTGAPTTVNPQYGTQDPDTGSIDFGDSLNFGNVNLSNISEIFMSVLNNLRELMGMYTEFGEFLAATFKFIPFPIWTLIEAGFGISVVILIYKYARGM